MQVHIFRGPGRVFGFMENTTGANLSSQFAPWNALKSVELNREEKQTPGVDADERLDDIEKHGFHITDAHARITESVIHSKQSALTNQFIGWLPYHERFEK